MTDICSSFKVISELIGRQAVMKHDRYRMLNYVVEEKYGNETLLYNLLTGELVSVSSIECAALKKCIVDNPIVVTLIEKWFLVPETFDDEQFCNQIDSLMKILTDNENRNRGITDYIIFTTTDCNARCFYCYEKNIPRISMTEETAQPES